MNERMQELYSKACLDARDLHPVDVVNFTHCMAEKFAELIVRECIRVGQKEFVNDTSKYPTFPVKAIKQHFGVEE